MPAICIMLHLCNTCTSWSFVCINIALYTANHITLQIFLHVHDLLMDNCIPITPGILNSNYLISEHIYIIITYGFIHQRLCCMFVLHRLEIAILVQFCIHRPVLNLMYLWTLLFAHCNIFRDFSAIILDPVYIILAKSEIVLYVCIGLNSAMLVQFSIHGWCWVYLI